MSNVLFRCSALGHLMTEPKTKAAKEAGEMSETAKAFIESVWLQNTYGYKEDFSTDQTMKGNLCEQDSMGLWQEYLKLTGQKVMLLKNKEHFANDFIMGTPDLINGQYVDDTKTSWSLRTFFEAEPTKDNIWQIRGYMDLLNKPKGRIVYCLVKTPEEMIVEQEKRFYFKFGCDEENASYREISEQIRHNNDVIDTIPILERVKVFEFENDTAEIQRLYAQICKARVYYDTLKLVK